MATGLAARPATAALYEALDLLRDSESTLADRAKAAAIHVSKSQTP
jgi:hypothetical protein